MNKNATLPGLFNLLFRVLSLGSKFLIILYIAQFIGTDQLGVYGLFSTSVLVGIQFLGFDFYVYNTRELLADKRQQPLIINQLYFHLIFYIGLAPMLFLLLWADVKVVEPNQFIFFVIILIEEHISNELYRLLLTLKKPVQASFILFIRTSSWILVLLLLWELSIVPKTLESLYFSWMIGNFISLTIPLITLYRIFNWSRTDFAFSKNWILNGVKISVPFFICTILLKILEYSNRYVIDFFHGKADVGIYTFYSSFAGALSVGVFTLVTMVQFPGIVELGNKGITMEFKKLIRAFALDTIKFSLLLSPIIIMIVTGIIWFLRKHVYWDDFPAFLVLVLANVFISVNYATHYILFALRKDRTILYSNMVGVLVCLALNFALVEHLHVLGASIALCVGFFIVLAYQYTVIKKILLNNTHIKGIA